MKKVHVFVSGCFDILHAGHVQFFEDARSLGDDLTVCFASDEVLKLSKGRKPSIPEDNKSILISSIKFVDHVVKSSNLDPVFDFKDHISGSKYHILAITDDDRNVEKKKQLCADFGLKLIILPKRNDTTQTSTTKILRTIHNLIEVPLRIDFAGGWLDVPKNSISGGYIVNCTISPLVSLENWPYEKGSGLGGSAAYSILQIKNGVQAELDNGVGWQDPAVISETGLCIWRSGVTPVLEAKYNPDWLTEKLLILWTGNSHNAPDITNKKRDYALIKKAGLVAKQGADKQDVKLLAKAVDLSYRVQIKEGMVPLPKISGALARKYLGAGHGGYALYIFKSKTDRQKAAKKFKLSKIIEPYFRSVVIS